MQGRRYDGAAFAGMRIAATLRRIASAIARRRALELERQRGGAFLAHRLQFVRIDSERLENRRGNL